MARFGWLTLFHIVIAVLAFVSTTGPASAQDTCYTNAQAGNCPNEGAANSAAMAAAQAYAAIPANNRTTCAPIAGKVGATWSVRVNVTPAQAPNCNAGTSTPSYIRYYDSSKSCGKEPSYTGVGPWSSGGAAKNGSLGCRNGCDGMWTRNADSAMTWNATGDACPQNEKDNCERIGEGYFYNSLLKVCEPPEGKCQDGRKPNSLGQCAPEPCPNGMLQQADGTCKNKDNECPAGQIKSPDGKCLPGDGQCADGEVRGKDGTCKKDTDGDGNPDEGEEGGEDPDGKKKDQFSGGDDCKTPPSCSGSPIMCGQARIQWRIDCNTRRNRNVAGGACNTPPVCTGEKCDALEYSGLLMQWRTACATERLAQGGSGGDQPAWTKVTGMSTDPGAGSSPDDLKVLTTKTLSVSDLDQSGIGGGGSCMGFASGGSNGITSGFMSAISTPPPFFCQYIAQIKALIITIAAVAAAVILARGGN